MAILFFVIGSVVKYDFNLERIRTISLMIIAFILFVLVCLFYCEAKKSRNKKDNRSQIVVINGGINNIKQVVKKRKESSP